MLESENSDYLVQCELYQSKLGDYENLVTKKDREITNQDRIIKALRHQLYGKKSERYITEDDSQLALDIFDEAEILQEISQSQEETEKPKKVRKSFSKKLPDYLETKVIENDLPPEERFCDCGCELTKIGVISTDRLEYIPAHVRKLVELRGKYVCKQCNSAPKLAPLTKHPIQKSIATSSLLAGTIVAKFCDHLPLYRQEQMWKRQDIYISRETMSGWVLQIAELLEPLYDKCKTHVVNSDYVCSDETGLRVIGSDLTKCYMWVHMNGDRDKRAVVYDYQGGRAGKYASEFLASFSGYHQSDAYSGYNEIHNRKGVIYVACWDHARRKFHEVYLASGKQQGIASTALSMIKELYDIEKKFRKQNSTHEEILSIRQDKSVEKLEEFRKYLLTINSGNENLTNAISYTLNNWDGLIAYTENSRLRMGNADAERAMKPFVIGRKNWLFCNSERGAKASAILFSIIETCKANGVNPFLYLKYVLDHIHEYRHRPQDLIELLPWNVDPENLKWKF